MSVGSISNTSRPLVPRAMVQLCNISDITDQTSSRSFFDLLQVSSGRSRCESAWGPNPYQRPMLTPPTITQLTPNIVAGKKMGSDQRTFLNSLTSRPDPGPYSRLARPFRCSNRGSNEVWMMTSQVGGPGGRLHLGSTRQRYLGRLSNMRRREIEAFLDRDRGSVEDERRRYWAARRQEGGPTATLQASDALFRHMKLVQPDWPTAAPRDGDLAHHVAWTRLLDRVARAIARR